MFNVWCCILLFLCTLDCAYTKLEAQKIGEPSGLQERPSLHMHLTLHLWVGAKRFSDVATHACLHLILKLHAKNVLQTFLGTLLRPQVYAIQVCYNILPVCKFMRLRQGLHCTLEARKSWDSPDLLQTEFRYDFRKGPREISAGAVFTVFTVIICTLLYSVRLQCRLNSDRKTVWKRNFEAAKHINK